MTRIDAQTVEAINAYLLVRTEIEPADLAFIFGSRHGVERFCDEAARLWHERYFPHVLVSGGVTPGDARSEASVLRSHLIDRGVDKRAILVEEQATNTGENVKFSMPVIEEHIGLTNVRSLIAIGKFCTSRRYVMTLERHWPEVRKMLHPVHYHDVPQERWMEDEELCARILGEWGRIEPYFQKGFIAEVDLPGREFRPGSPT